MLKPDDIDYLASLSRVAVPEDERANFGGDLEKILNYVSQLTTLNLPPIQADEVAKPYNVFRDDASTPVDRARREELLAAAPSGVERGFIKVKKILGN